MAYKYTYQSGETFSYKWWKITVDEYVFGSIRIYFSIDAIEIITACSAAAKKSGYSNEDRLISIVKDSFSEAHELSLREIDHITVFHIGWNITEKCRRDALSHVDLVLGDGLEYVKKNNLLPSLSMFF